MIPPKEAGTDGFLIAALFEAYLRSVRARCSSDPDATLDRSTAHQGDRHFDEVRFLARVARKAKVMVKPQRLDIVTNDIQSGRSPCAEIMHHDAEMCVPAVGTVPRFRSAKPGGAAR